METAATKAAEQIAGHLVTLEHCPTHVSTVFIERRFNLDNLESLTIGITLQLASSANPAAAVSTLETIANALHSPKLVNSPELQRARLVLGDLSSIYAKGYDEQQLEQFRQIVADHNEARQRKEHALELLSRISAVVSTDFQDEKETWPIDAAQGDPF